MAVDTTRPDATVANGGSTVTGAATRHEALADDSDSSYVTVDATDNPVFGFAEPTIPAGALAKSTALRMRCARPGAAPEQIVSTLSGPDELGEQATGITWTSPTTITVLSAAITDEPTTIEVQVANLAALGPGVRIYELFVDTTYVAQPVTVISLPTGTLTETNRPIALWGVFPLDTDGGLPTHYEAKLFNDAQYGAGGFDPDTSTPVAESGIVAGPSTPGVWQPDDGVPNDTYRIYARSAQTVHGELFWSDWDLINFAVDVDVPADPTLTLTADDDNARILIEVEEGAGGAVTTDLFEVQASYDGGASWAVIRDGVLTPVGGEASALDYEAPNGATAQYRVRAAHTFGSGSQSYSAWVQDSESWSSTKWWIKHPTNPALNLIIRVHSEPGHDRPARQGIHDVLGRPHPIVVSDKRGAPRGQLVLRVDTEEEQEALNVLLDSRVSLLVSAPAADHWEDRWVRFGDQGRARLVDKSFVEGSMDTLPWVEVARPDSAGAIAGDENLVLI